MNKKYCFFCLLGVLFLVSCQTTEEFEPGSAYFLSDNTITLYYSGEYNVSYINFELWTFNPKTEKRSSLTITTIFKDDFSDRLIIEYSGTVESGEAMFIYVFAYENYETAITVNQIKP